MRTLKVIDTFRRARIDYTDDEHEQSWTQSIAIDSRIDTTETGAYFMNGGKLVVRSLKEHGVDFVFGLVDTTILDIIDALY